MQQLDNRKRLIGLKSKAVFTSLPTGAAEYAIRMDGAVFTRTHSHDPESGYRVPTKWARIDNPGLAEFLRETSAKHVSIRGVDFIKRITTRLKLPQDIGV